MVCIAIATDKRLQNVTNYFLFSLALADLFVCSIVMPLALLAEVRHGLWTWDFPMCLLYSYSDVFLCSASIVHMSVISLDRYLGISKPLKTRNKSRTIVIVKIIFVWVMTTVISSPLAVIAILNPKNILHSNQCAIANQFYMIYGSTLSFLIPFIIMAVTYVKTTQLLNKQASLLTQKTNDRFHNGLRRTLPHRKLGCVRNSSYSAGNTTTATHKTSVVSYTSLNTVNSIQQGTPKLTQNGEKRFVLYQQQQNSSSTETEDVQLINKHDNQAVPPRAPPKLEKQSSALKLQFGKLKTRTSSVLTSITTKVGRRNSLQSASMELANEHKATRVLAVVFVCFFVCWTPFFFINFLIGFCGDNCAPPPWVSSLFLWLGYISSIINPIIYTIFNRRFRQAFLRILRCQCLHSLRDSSSLNYSRNHTFIPPDTHTCYKNTAMGLLAAGSRAISAPAAPLIMPHLNLQHFWSENREIESPDSIGNGSGGWNTPTPPLRQAIFSSFKNRPLAFPPSEEVTSINNVKKPNLNRLFSSTPPSPARSIRSSTNTSYRSRGDGKQLEDNVIQIMQTSDYDNLKPEMASCTIQTRQQNSLSESEDEAVSENKPLITQNFTTPKRLLFSTLTGTTQSPKHQVHGSSNFKFNVHSIPRSASENFSSKITPSKFHIIKSTTVTEQLSIASATPIRVIPLRPEKNEFKKDTYVTDSQSIDSTIHSNASTPLDSTVKSGVMINNNSQQINETYL
uniref:G-protein coupled receptors family 1 profile domain-containing protein n=1 Tax=Panagrolaimus superbus TaxID=310955 RepID=A0A914YXC0_9BILA